MLINLISETFDTQVNDQEYNPTSFEFTESQASVFVPNRLKGSDILEKNEENKNTGEKLEDKKFETNLIHVIKQEYISSREGNIKNKIKYASPSYKESKSNEKSLKIIKNNSPDKVKRNLSLLKKEIESINVTSSKKHVEVANSKLLQNKHIILKGNQQTISINKKPEKAKNVDLSIEIAECLINKNETERERENFENNMISKVENNKDDDTKQNYEENEPNINKSNKKKKSNSSPIKRYASNSPLTKSTKIEPDHLIKTSLNIPGVNSRTSQINEPPNLGHLKSRDVSPFSDFDQDDMVDRGTKTLEKKRLKFGKRHIPHLNRQKSLKLIQTTLTHNNEEKANINVINPSIMPEFKYTNSENNIKAESILRTADHNQNSNSDITKNKNSVFLTPSFMKISQAKSGSKTSSTNSDLTAALNRIISEQEDNFLVEYGSSEIQKSMNYYAQINLLHSSKEKEEKENEEEEIKNLDQIENTLNKKSNEQGKKIIEKLNSFP